MSWIQRFLYRHFPETAKEMEAESRTWMLRCPSCGHEQSYWDIGGVRWKAHSRGKRVGMRCRSCHRFVGHQVYRKQVEPERDEE
jgi:hypothetical protein